MARITPAGDAARAALASLPEFSGGDKPISQLSDAYARRLLRGAEQALASGVTPSRQAARGHILTPEHPTSRQPRLPEPARVYLRAEKAKYAPPTREPGESGQAPSAPSQRVTGAFEEGRERLRPTRHARPPFEGHIPFADTGEIYTVRSEREADATLHYASGLEPVGRVRLTLQVYDCTRAQWFPVLAHTWKYGGVAIDDLYTLWRDHGGSLEDWLIDQINGGADSDSDRPRGGITHICLYEITILPRARLTG